MRVLFMFSIFSLVFIRWHPRLPFSSPIRRLFIRNSFITSFFVTHWRSISALHHFIHFVVYSLHPFSSYFVRFHPRSASVSHFR
ncbi:hypothetical protein BJ165DRAFT_1511978 [Panaeolus papilionaceus]|nr:hypothetical protein BJ165DRAFT_1511978 [Panaeolus papilionaceus]